MGEIIAIASQKGGGAGGGGGGFRSKTFFTTIPRNIALSEASMNRKPAIIYAPNAIGTLAYIELAKEFISKQDKND